MPVVRVKYTATRHLYTTIAYSDAWEWTDEILRAQIQQTLDRQSAHPHAAEGFAETRQLVSYEIIEPAPDDPAEQEGQAR